MKYKYVKYPRTYHLSFSEGSTSDDKFLKDFSSLNGADIVVTLKMDGENTTLYNDHIHARSLDSDNHYSRNWVKQFHSTFAHDIPNNMRICGENMYAKHSIYYPNLESYFYGFSVWENDLCLSWQDTLEYFSLLGIVPVKTLYEGIYDESILLNIAKNLDKNTNEGFVVRLKDSFKYKDFYKCVAKYVRANHVTTSNHWQHQAIIKNKLTPSLFYVDDMIKYNL